MSMYRNRKMQPRNGHTLLVLVAARISGCQSQKDVSLEDQEEHARKSPLVFQMESPADIKKMKRHRHPRYRVQPLDGYDRPDI